MNTIKVAITIPQNLVSAIDILSKQSKLSRSRFITDVLQEKVTREKEKIVKEIYDRIFSDDTIQKEQHETSRWFDGHDVPEGQEW
jgi:phage/plasmid-associated DNA primase